MTDGILVILKPFVKDQKFYVFKNGEATIEAYIPYDENFSSELAEIAYDNNVSKIEIAGTKSFAMQTQKVIIAYNNSKFTDKKLEVEILSKR